MARMIPATIHPHIRSRAERRLFELIRDAPGTDDWVCLHSLGLARHARKRRGEIDFLLLTRKGIFVLEVKGGRVAREEGVWLFTDRYGDVHKKSESPFDQAASAMFALEQELREEFRREDRRSSLLFGSGVMFPDITFGDTGAEADARQVYDSRDRRRPLTEFVDRLAEYARERDQRPRYSPSEKDIEAIAAYLRGDFDLVPSLGALADSAAAELLSLEQEQYGILDALEMYQKPRIVVQGGAGTGKTLLALEAVRREARKSDGDVLLVCYNRLLARFLQESLEREGSQGSEIVVKSIFSLLNDLIAGSSLATEFHQKRQVADPDTVYRKLFPEYGSLALIDSPVRPFRAVIVDEAQDMMVQGLLDVIDGFVKGGLESGRWWFFCDVNNQAAVYGSFDQAAFSRLERFGNVNVLTSNRRNTKQIAAETVMLTRPRIHAPAVIEGIPVKYSWYKKEDDQPAALCRILKKLIADDVAAGRVTVLSPRAVSKACAASLTEPSLTEITAENVSQVLAGQSQSVSYCSVSSFKGLENDFIVLTDIESLDADWWRSVIYVGMSRARVGLHLLLPESLRSTYETCLRSWLQKSEDAALRAAKESTQ